MPDRRDPLAALRRPVAPLAPRPEFAASLRRRLEEELGMTSPATPATSATTTDEPGGPGAVPATRRVAGHGDLAMVHLRVADADRAARFFGELFGWETERYELDGHVSWYTLNTATTVRLLDDPDVPPVVPNYAVADVAAAVRAVEAVGGRVAVAEPDPDGGGWARGDDDQGVPWLVYRPGGHHRGPAPTRAATGDVGLVFIRADAPRAERFYGPVLGWRFHRDRPESQYFDTVPLVGVFDEAAAFGRDVAPSATLYLLVDAMAPALRRVDELGGRAGEAAQDMGPYFSAVCTDDQGTSFGVMASRAE
jgi:predicted enzyme related to lactoylglutathione lyase